jgi:hypothetical protein
VTGKVPQSSKIGGGNITAHMSILIEKEAHVSCLCVTLHANFANVCWCNKEAASRTAPETQKQSERESSEKKNPDTSRKILKKVFGWNEPMSL